jgi:hypothetical protein
MNRLSLNLLQLLLPVALICSLSSCGPSDNEAGNGAPSINGAGSQAGGAPGPQGGGAAQPQGQRPIRQIMMKLSRGPNSLSSLLDKQLESEPVDWPTVETEAKDYVQSTMDLNKFDPPRGAKESWDQHTSEYADLAKELEKAAVAKNKQESLAAHEQLKNSCQACHNAHRAGPGGRPGMGGGQGPGRGPITGGPAPGTQGYPTKDSRPAPGGDPAANNPPPASPPAGAPK